MNAYTFKYDGCNGAKWGVSDFYDDFRAELVRAIDSGADFDTGWYGVKKEIQSASIARHGDKFTVQVSVSNDFDCEGSAERTIEACATTEQTIEAIASALDDALNAAASDQSDNSAVDMYIVGRAGAWEFTYLVDCVGTDYPPGDHYYRWGWQETETDDAFDLLAHPQEISTEDARAIEQAIAGGLDVPTVIGQWTVRSATE